MAAQWLQAAALCPEAAPGHGALRGAGHRPNGGYRLFVNRQYWGHAFDLLRRGEQFLLDHVPIPGRVVPGKMIREDRPWYPSRATREAIAKLKPPTTKSREVESRLESQLKSQLESLPRRVLGTLAAGPLGKAALAAGLGQKQVSGQLHAVVRDLLSVGWIEPTIPDKPNSRLQRYRLTEKGRATLAAKPGNTPA